MSGENSIRVASVDDFDTDGYKIFAVGKKEVGVFHYRGGFVAYENHCPHFGGPVCQGKRIPRVHEEIDSEKRSVGLRFSEDHHIICPWHGWEFDLATGIHPGDPNERLKPVEVSVRGKDIYVSLRGV